MLLVVTWPLITDITLMVFVGFGLIFAYLRTHQWTTVGYTFVIGAWAMQCSILFDSLFKRTDTYSNGYDGVGLNSLVKADYTAAVCLIAC
jgi:ammonium transporter Rh